MGLKLLNLTGLGPVLEVNATIAREEIERRECPNRRQAQEILVKGGSTLNASKFKLRDRTPTTTPPGHILVTGCVNRTLCGRLCSVR